MPDIFFTSDTHLGHAAIIRHCARPFKDVAEMNAELIKRWNDVVGKKDTVYHLGDFAFTNGKGWIELINALNGRIILIRGNHDYRVNKWVLQGFPEVYDLKDIKVDNQKIVLCHFPMLSWNKSYHGSWMLHGHSHGNTRFDPEYKRLDVGVDVHNYTPIRFDRVREIFNTEGYQYPEVPPLSDN